MRTLVTLMGIGMVVATLGTVGIVSRAASQQIEPDFRDLYIVRGNPDGTLKCAKWCGLTEPCC